MHCARCARFCTRVLAEEILLLGGCQRGMGICRSDHTEFEGIDAELLFKLQPELETGTGVFVLQHLRPLELRQVEIAFVPKLVAGELVIGRQERM